MATAGLSVHIRGVNTGDLAATLTTLLSELLDGPGGGGYMLNRGDPGVLRSLDKLSASAASATPTGGASIAAHVDHLRYGLSLLNEWTPGAEPWRVADWTASWQRTVVSDVEWRKLRSEFRDQARRWVEALRTPRDVSERELNIIIGSIAHVAYHVGAIRQIDRAARGPSAIEELQEKR